MKYYKKINNKFLGFYDSELNEQQLYIFSKNFEGETEKQEKTLKPNFYELSEKKWVELLNGQSEGKEIKVLDNGELGLYEYPLCTQDFVNKIFNWNTKQWEEGATAEEQLDYYKQKIIECTKEIYIQERAGFKPSNELIKKKEYYLNLHMDIAQSVAEIHNKDVKNENK